jgi:hypothetical protein
VCTVHCALCTVLIVFNCPAAVPPSQILYAFNGAVVGLAIDSSRYSPLAVEQQQFRHCEYEEGTDSSSLPWIPMATPLCPCVGLGKCVSYVCAPQHTYSAHPSDLGIVRGIDPRTSTLFVLTPVSAHELSKVNLLLKGGVELPASMWSAPKGHALPEPYMTADAVTVLGTGGSAMRSRSNLKRGGGK